MKLIIRDFWEYENQAVLCIPVPGTFESDKLARHPIAREAARRFPDLEERINRANMMNAGLPNKINDMPLMYSFPYSGMEDIKPDLDVIQQSAKYLASYPGENQLYVIPKLEWRRISFEDIFDRWKDFLDDKFHVIQHEPAGKRKKKQRRLLRKRRRR